MVKVLVLGATGQQGSATARALLSSGKNAVRAYVRDGSSPKAKELAALGAEIVEGGDWDKDVAALDKALAGVEAVFFISNPNFKDLEAEVKAATNIVEAAKRAGTVNHIVYSTVAGVENYEDLPGLDANPVFRNYWESKAKGEELVKNAGFAHYTILRPTEFMSNWTREKMAMFQIPDLVKEGVWHTAMPPSFILSEIDTEDIGPDTFVGGPNRILKLTGERLTVADLIAQLGEAIGKKLSIYTYTPEEAEEAAKKNPVVAGQLTRLAKQEGLKPLDHYGLKFTTFKEHLANHLDEVKELYKNVP
ncbi:NAD dependent epimerase/dehydratase [Hypoxylon sp. EC38]|nr:NAD dependent epimerase/dehydratase [Hypoxylon sp. EC38]